MPLNKRGRCVQCGAKKPSGRGRQDRCDDCAARKAERDRERTAERKVAGQCTRCGVPLEDDYDLCACPSCTETRYSSEQARQKRRRRSKRTREMVLAREREQRIPYRQRRRELGLCFSCSSPSIPGTGRCRACLDLQVQRNRLRRYAKAAGRRLGSAWDRLLADVERLAPTHREEGVRTWDLIHLVEDDIGPISSTRAGAERKMYRVIADLLREGRLVKVDIGCGDFSRGTKQMLVGYRRPEPRPRRVRQPVTSATALTTVEPQVGVVAALRASLRASQTATVAVDDSRASAAA
jgi:hypothetical protein